MNFFSNGQNFPRKLSEIEEYWLNLILPENRPGYKIYRDRIKNLFVIGYGKFPPFNLILGEKETKPDLTIPPQSIVATGTFYYKFGKVNVSIFEEFENQIELDIQSEGFNYNEISSDNLIDNEIKFFTYSNWSPGQRHPFDNSELRQVEIDKNILIAISKSHKRIWMHNRETQTNKFIPITNFYQELLRVLKIHNPKIITDINYFFLNLNKFSDAQIKEAFINYNRSWKKVDLVLTIESEVKENWFQKFLKRLLWKK